MAATLGAPFGTFQPQRQRGCLLILLARLEGILSKGGTVEIAYSHLLPIPFYWSPGTMWPAQQGLPLLPVRPGMGVTKEAEVPDILHQRHCPQFRTGGWHLWPVFLGTCWAGGVIGTSALDLVVRVQGAGGAQCCGGSFPQVVWFVSAWTIAGDRIHSSLNLCRVWNLQAISYLGIKIPVKWYQLYKHNYLTILEAVRSNLKQWSGLNVSCFGRVALIKMSILPKLLYSMLCSLFPYK